MIVRYCQKAKNCKTVYISHFARQQLLPNMFKNSVEQNLLA